MKNFLSRIAKDKALITAMCACIILVTAASLITMYNKNRQTSDGGIVSENQTEEETSGEEVNEALVETEEVTEEETEVETKNLTLRIETEAELAKVTEEETDGIETDSSLVDEVSNNDVEEANAQAEAEDQAEEGVDAENVNAQVEDANVQAEGENAQSEDVGASLTEEVSEAAAETQVDTDTYTVDLSMDFTETSTLVWPVSGEVIREFSMDTTVWFSTLQQYRTSDAIQIQSEAGTEVVAAATGRVTAVGVDDELGNFVVMDIGNGYSVTYAQLSDIIVEPGNYVTAGTSFACIAEPTYYYVVDGAHLYFKLTCDGELLDPLDYLE